MQLLGEAMVKVLPIHRLESQFAFSSSISRGVLPLAVLPLIKILVSGFTDAYTSSERIDNCGIDYSVLRTQRAPCCGVAIRRISPGSSQECASGHEPDAQDSFGAALKSRRGRLAVVQRNRGRRAHIGRRITAQDPVEGRCRVEHSQQLPSKCVVAVPIAPSSVPGLITALRIWRGIRSQKANCCRADAPAVRRYAWPRALPGQQVRIQAIVAL